MYVRWETDESTNTRTILEHINPMIISRYQTVDDDNVSYVSHVSAAGDFLTRLQLHDFQLIQHKTHPGSTSIDVLWYTITSAEPEPTSSKVGAVFLKNARADQCILVASPLGGISYHRRFPAHLSKLL